MRRNGEDGWLEREREGDEVGYEFLKRGREWLIVEFGYPFVLVRGFG